ncbi:MAG TPA: hypothetical protein VFL10_02380 [Ornithinibacter sp.]|nr:hypothetical protein [Ornithinibacter sp.]
MSAPPASDARWSGPRPEGRWTPTERASRSTLRDDRILGYTRGLSLFIAPFLLVAFVLLYVFPGRTGRLFAWPIRGTMTPMVLASAYLGGFWFFVCVLRERRWAAVKLGFPAVALFATLLGIATVVHWEKFSHGHVAFWLWAGLYFTAPFLVVGAWVANTSVAARPGDDEDRLGVVARWAVGAVGLGALVTGIAMFLSPATMIGIWPWPLTPLTCRVVGAIFCLGSAGLGVVRDPRWVTVRLMLQVEVLMVALMGVAAVRARDELLTGRPLTWLMLVGFVAVLVGSGVLWLTHERSG